MDHLFVFCGVPLERSKNSFLWQWADGQKRRESCRDENNVWVVAFGFVNMCESVSWVVGFGVVKVCESVSWVFAFGLVKVSESVSWVVAFLALLCVNLSLGMSFLILLRSVNLMGCCFRPC